MSQPIAHNRVDQLNLAYCDLREIFQFIRGARGTATLNAASAGDGGWEIFRSTATGLLHTKPHQRSL